MWSLWQLLNLVGVGSEQWARGHSFLIPDFLSIAVPPPPLNEDSGVFFR